MKCRKVKRSLLAYIDRELNADEFNEIRQHLGKCPSCREEYDRLNSLNESIGGMYKKAEMGEESRIDLVDNVYEALSKNHLPFKADTSPREFNAFSYKRNRGFFSIYGKQIKGGLVAIFIMCIVTFAFASKWDLMRFGREKSAQSDMYKVLKSYTTLDNAEKKIKEIPFVIPSYVPEGYKLKDIEYSEDYSLRKGVKFTYQDKNYNEIEISYSQRYQLAGQQGTSDDILHIGNGAISVVTEQFMGCPKPEDKATGNTELSRKRLVVPLKDYGIMAVINYNRRVSDSDKSGDAELAKIVSAYLSSGIFDLSPLNGGKSEYETDSYKSFQEMNSAKVIKISEPSYLPEGFSLKDITYKKVFEDFFIINARYENSKKSVINIDYRLKGKGWVTINNSGKIETIERYAVTVSNAAAPKVGTLEPAGNQKTMPYIHPDYDINIFMQINPQDDYLNSKADSEIMKVAESVNK